MKKAKKLLLILVGCITLMVAEFLILEDKHFREQQELLKRLYREKHDYYLELRKIMKAPNDEFKMKIKKQKKELKE